MIIYLLLSVVSFIYILYLYFTRHFTYWENRNVIGPKPLPFFGNTIDFHLRRKRLGLALQDIYKQFSKEKFVGIFTMTTPTLMINDIDLIKQIMIKDFDCFTDRGVEFSKEGLGLNLFHADGDSWRMLRGKFTPLFTTGKLKNMLYLIVERGASFMQYVDKLYQENPEQDVYPMIQKYTMSTITACAFGMDLDIMKDDFSFFMKIDKKIFNANFFFDLDMLYPGILKKLNGSLFPNEINEYFSDVVKNIVETRNGKPSGRKDFMDLMLQLREEGELHGSNKLSNDATSLEITDSVMAAQAFVFYIAGYETSATTMTFLLYELAKNPKYQDKLIAEIDEVMAKHNGQMTYDALFEMKYLDMVFDEAARMYPIVDFLQRNAKTDYKLPGTDLVIEKDQTIFVSSLGIHYDDRYFKNPYKFDPERFAPENAANINLAAYMPFGTGPRNCIGDDVVKNIVETRNGKPSGRKDFMDLMLQLREEGELHGSNKLSNDATSLEITDSVMAAQAFVFYIAGYETSATTMTFLLYELAKNPKYQDKLIAEIDEVMAKHNGQMTYDALFEMKYLDMVFDEAARMYPIVDFLQRNAKTDYKLPGTDLVIEKDQTIFVSSLGIHYDDRYFKNPYKFDPERFAPENAANINLAAYMPFGTGPRNCIGMRFAKVQSRVCIVNILSKYRVEPSPKLKKEMTYDRIRLSLAPEGGMPLILVPRTKQTIL